jgi:hypothetical protein
MRSTRACRALDAGSFAFVGRIFAISGIFLSCIAGKEPIYENKSERLLSATQALSNA